MEYLFLSNYDGGTNWTIKSSLGDIKKGDNAKDCHPLLKTIVSFLEVNEYKAFENELKDVLSLGCILINFDFVMLCEDGNITIIKDTNDIFKKQEAFKVSVEHSTPYEYIDTNIYSTSNVDDYINSK